LGEKGLEEHKLLLFNGVLKAAFRSSVVGRDRLFVDVGVDKRAGNDGPAITIVDDKSSDLTMGE
jgi:hypothetical protein